MKGGDVFGNGPAHANGTRTFGKPGTLSKAETGTGQANGSLRGEQAPDFAGGGAPCTAPLVDPEQFHPVGFTKADQWRAKQTIATYCDHCPMTAECLAWGLRVGRGQGIWGGVRFDRPSAKGRRAS